MNHLIDPSQKKKNLTLWRPSNIEIFIAMWIEIENKQKKINNKTPTPSSPIP